MELPLLRKITRVQDQLLELLGSSREQRAEIFERMLVRDAREATSYWLQFVVASGIATLGLALGSTAVIIGAMLVAPLMGPIVSLGMGLSTGAPFLVLRSSARVAGSVLLAILFSSLITYFLPFHQVNAEISGRAVPTALDLATAAFCAIAGVYASLRPGSDTAATAAGTSIGISLVPPLCAAGYGVGIGDWRIASGATLLFLTNFAAIVVVATILYFAVGFAQVDVLRLEREELATDRSQKTTIAMRLARRLESIFSSRFGLLFRFLMPLLLLAFIYVPLSEGLTEVAWQVKVRGQAQERIDNLDERVIESRLNVDRHRIEVLLVILGREEVAAQTRDRLRREIEAIAGVVPRVEVLAVPDASSFAGLETSLKMPLPAARIAPVVPVEQRVVDTMTLLDRTIEQSFPSVAGEVFFKNYSRTDAGLAVHLTILGNDIDETAKALLETRWAAELHMPVSLSWRAFPRTAQPLDRSSPDLQRRMNRWMEDAKSVPGLHLCVQLAEERGRDARRAALEKATWLSQLMEHAAPLAIQTSQGDEETYRFSIEDCAPTTSGNR